jgi:two-component system LytT family sensor kinase
MIAITRWHWALAVGFWIFLAATYGAQLVWMAQTSGERINNLTAGLIWQLSYYAAWLPATIVIWRFTADWIPDTAGAWRRILTRHLLIFLLVLVVLTLVSTAVQMPLAVVPGSASQVFWMQIFGRGYLTLLMYIIVACIGAAMTLQDRYRERQATAAALQVELASARLLALRNHLEPHFLFNSLHSIASLARADDSAGVVRLTASLGDVLRYVLDAGDASARLSDEFAIVERYLEIQRARHADRLVVSLTLPPEAERAKVPVLAVQPLVENALKHGLTPRVKVGTLAVRASVHAGHVRIEVEDDGVGLPDGWTMTSSRGTGLRNLASRLAAEFGDQAALTVSARQSGGVLASITLPFVRV